MRCEERQRRASNPLDLDAAVAKTARQLADLGDTDSLDVRRAKVVGDIARQQLAFDYDADTSAPTGSNVVLFAHVSEEALNGTESVGRCGNTRSRISVEQIRQWCGNPHANITVKPVVDLNDHIHVEAYEAPDRLKEQNALVDIHCVFPWCNQPAARCDCDHTIPYAKGDTTCSCNTAPLCRRHHRAKTHGGWTTTPSAGGPTCGPPPTASDSSATTWAPTNPDCPAPHPGHQLMAGAPGMPVCDFGGKTRTCSRLSGCASRSSRPSSRPTT